MLPLPDAVRPLHILDLDGLDAGGDTVFGGKAHGLFRLLAAGVRVPSGFAVEATLASPESWRAADRNAFLERAGQLCRNGLLAVRSSALGEDSPSRSFAGMFETVLGVATPREALSAAARCIASGAGPRVLAYAGTDGPIPVGLVVQSLVRARAAGVCFTRDPSGVDGSIVIEAVAGQGEALVSGHAQPERWRAYRSGLGGWECRLVDALGALTSEQATAIAVEAARLEVTFGCPLDLEWALDAAGMLWWLQARPITAVVAPPNYVIQRSFKEVDDGPVTVWSNWNVRETLPDPLHPLTWTHWRDAILPMVTNQAMGVPRDSPLMRQVIGLDLVHGRLYFNMNAVLAGPGAGMLIPRLMSIMDSTAGATVTRLLSTGVLRPRRIHGSRMRVAAGMLAASARILARVGPALTPTRGLRSLEADGAAIKGRREVALLTDAELVDELYLWDGPECRRLRNGLLMEAMATLVYIAATHAFRDHPRARRLLTTGILTNPTTQISLGVDDLVEAARALAPVFLADFTTPELLEALGREPGGEAWLERFRTFLWSYGHRGPMEFDLAAPRWSEDPSMIVDLVRAGLRSTGREPVRSRIECLAVERRLAVEEATRLSRPWRRPLLRMFARLVELYMPLREAPKHYGVLVFERIRYAAMEIGRRLASLGVIGTDDDVFFIELAELATLATGMPPDRDYRALVGERRSLLERFRAERAPSFLRSDGVPVVEEGEAPEARIDGVLHGAAISAGCATGPVCILRSPDPRLMADGDVLVLEFADPGWTPLFPRAAAVVMEVGGVMCHAAVVARELGIPAVFGVRGATGAFTAGERVTVDGTLGTVSLASPCVRFEPSG